MRLPIVRESLIYRVCAGLGSTFPHVYSSLTNNYNSINSQLSSGINYLKWRGSTGNLNWSLTNGIWAYDPSTVDHPNDYGVCLVLNNGVDSYTGYGWIFQLAFGTNGHIYSRCSINAANEGKFSGWVTIK